MAISGKLELIKDQLNSVKFKKAFEYLEKAKQFGTEENKRLLALPMGAFNQNYFAKDIFALEQVYNTKERTECFFESHEKYIDIQFILEGEETIEVCDIDTLVINTNYDEQMDLIKYNDTNNSSILKLKKGYIAIFYPNDAQMPCLKINRKSMVIKTVVKVEI